MHEHGCWGDEQVWPTPTLSQAEQPQAASTVLRTNTNRFT